MGVISLKAQRVLDYSSSNDHSAPFFIGVHVGTQGFGLHLTYKQNDFFAYRLSVSDAPVGFNNARSWGSQAYNLHMKARYMNVAAQFEFRPFNRLDHPDFTQKLVAVAGIAYFFKAQADVRATPKNAYYYGDIPISPENQGTISGTAKWKPVAPYLGIGLRAMKVAPKLFMNIDLGTYYLSSPDVSMSANKLLEGNTSNEATIQQNLKNYHWLPVVQAGLSYRF